GCKTGSTQFVDRTGFPFPAFCEPSSPLVEGPRRYASSRREVGNAQLTLGIELEKGFIPVSEVFAPRGALAEFVSSHDDNMPARASAYTVRSRGARTLTIKRPFRRRAHRPRLPASGASGH